jgi:hypothetical protein
MGRGGWGVIAKIRRLVGAGGRLFANCSHISRCPLYLDVDMMVRIRVCIFCIGGAGFDLIRSFYFEFNSIYRVEY